MVDADVPCALCPSVFGVPTRAGCESMGFGRAEAEAALSQAATISLWRQSRSQWRRGCSREAATTPTTCVRARVRAWVRVRACSDTRRACLRPQHGVAH